MKRLNFRTTLCQLIIASFVLTPLQAFAVEDKNDDFTVGDTDFHPDNRHFQVPAWVDEQDGDDVAQIPEVTAEEVTASSKDNLKEIEEELDNLLDDSGQEHALHGLIEKTNGADNRLLSVFVAQNSRKVRAKPKVVPSRGATPASDKKQLISKAQKLIAAGQYNEASILLFNMAKSTQYQNERAQIEYILGRVLFELKLYQTSAFIFYDVVHIEGKNTKSRYLRQSLEKLSLAGDALDSDLLLKFAVSQVNENDFPEAERDILYYRTGELRLQEKKFKEAAVLFAKVRPNSSLFTKARYNLGLSLTEAGDLDAALSAFDDLTQMNSAKQITDKNRVNGILAKARVLYQKKDWAGATEAYREIPRDTEQWHESLFELSWTQLRMAKFRNALSNFHSLHSPYYDDFYQPESLLLRAIVYLYICRYDEMEKTLDLFEKVYKPVQLGIRSSLETDRDPMLYYKEINRIAENFDAIKARQKGSRTGMKLPFLVGRQILKEGDVRKAQNYLHKLYDEHKRVIGMNTKWQSSPIGRYSRKIVDKRIEATRAFIGKLVRRHMILMQVDLRDLFEQVGFLRFESTSGRKEVVKKEIQGKGVVRNRVDDESSRNYFIQNGYEYWPFKGEYWLDEIGNYHYLGVQACE